jgi:hypothetical protein
MGSGAAAITKNGIEIGLMVCFYCWGAVVTPGVYSMAHENGEE